MVEFDIVELAQRDKPLVFELLATDDLRPEYILAEGSRYWGAFSHGRLIGVIGCEYENRYGLLRSALVLRPYRGCGVASRLTHTLLKAARMHGHEAIYLFSTDAGKYWEGLGFRKTPVEEIVSRMPGVHQVKLFDALGWLPTEVAYRYLL